MNFLFYLLVFLFFLFFIFYFTLGDHYFKNLKELNFPRILFYTSKNFEKKYVLKITLEMTVTCIQVKYRTV